MSSFAATVKKKRYNSSETLVDIYQTTRLKIPLNRNKCSYSLPQVFQMSQLSVTFVTNLFDWLKTLSQLF